MCLECGVPSHDGSGWRAEIAVDVREDELEPDDVAGYCPRCWEREFGR